MNSYIDGRVSHRIECCLEQGHVQLDGNVVGHAIELARWHIDKHLAAEMHESRVEEVVERPFVVELCDALIDKS